jgi:hypothetical protein
VPPRLATFAGRADLLERIRQGLPPVSTWTQRGAVVAVTALRGMGGVGKTQLAIEYAWRRAGEYTLVWWINAEQAGLIGEQMAQLASAVGLATTGATGTDANAALDHLRRTDHWLLIFDNATNVEDLQSWLPSGNGHVLITSRNPSWGAVAHRVDVDVFARPESISYLHARVPSIDENTAAELAAELGDLPLALSQAAAYLERTQLPPHSYLIKFRTRREQMITAGSDQIYAGRIDTAWSIALERLATTAPATVQLLNLAAFCAPEPIPLSLFTERATRLPGPLSDTVTSAHPEADLDAIIAAALDFSLCRRLGSTMQVHRLVQAVIRHRLPAESRQATVNMVTQLLTAAHPGDPDRPTTWPAWTALGPHILHTFTHEPQPDDAPGLRHLVSQFCWHLVARGDYVGAHRIAIDLHDVCHTTLGPDDPVTLAAATNLATTLRGLNHVDAARTLNEDVLARCRRLYGDDHHDTLDAANQLVSSLSADQDNVARDLAEDTLTRCRRTLGDNHNLTLATAGNLANTMVALGNHQRARDLAEETLAGFRNLNGDDNQGTLWAACLLVRVLHSQGDDATAKRLGEPMLATCRRLLGDEHRYTTAIADTLSHIRDNLDEPAQIETASGDEETAQ